MKLHSELIEDIFSKCFFRDDEILNGRPIGDYVMVKSVIYPENPPIVFSAEHLNEKKSDILDLMDMIPGINDGVSFDTLNKFDWCDELDFDKIVIMGEATKSIGLTIVEFGNDKAFSIKRDKTYDSEIIKGLPKENIPEQKMELKKGYTDEEKVAIKQNGERISQELEEFITTINRGLGFYGIRVEKDANERNKINFYDKDNNLIFERTFLDADGILGFEGMLNQRLKCEFEDKVGNQITYLYDNRHIFLLSGPKGTKYGTRIELTGEEGNYAKIMISCTNADDEYVIKSLEVSDNFFSIQLDNAFGHYGNYEDGTTRSLIYHSSLHREPYLHFAEKVWPQNGAYLYCDTAGFKFFGEEAIVPYSNRKAFDMLATNIVAHPRNREALNYLLDELERKMTGIRDFVLNNSNLYKYLLEVEYVQDPITESIVDRVINHACDFKKREEPKR